MDTPEAKIYRNLGILAKMAEQEIKDFSKAELDRCFAGCLSPFLCKRGVKMMLADGLTMLEVYQDS